MSLPSALGPQHLGTRVVVRRLVPGETGPTGGPAFTDVLGVLESWQGSTLAVRTEAGELVVVERSLVVSGKPVPPRPSVHSRVTAAEAQRRSLVSWPAPDTRPLGEWLLRAAGGFSARANSALLLGDPGLPADDALAAVEAFYAERGLPAWAQVVVGSAEERLVLDHGWVTARPGEADSVLLVAGVARVARALRRAEPLPGTAPSVTVAPTADEAWLSTDERAAQHRTDALAVLEGPDRVRFVSLRDPDLVAKGRVAWSGSGDGSEPWAGITDVWVSPEHRRRGLATAVLRVMVGEVAEDGVTTVFLQTREDNPGALALYERLGFERHHTYRYLSTSPRSGRGSARGSPRA